MVVDGKIYIGSLDGNLYCLDASSGTIQWKVATGGVIYATPAVVDNAVFIDPSTLGAGTVLKLNAATGAILFNVSVPYSHRSYGAGDNMVASPTITNGMVFVRTGLYTNYALNATTGATIWTYNAVSNENTPQQNGGTTQICAMLYKYGVVYLNDFYGVTALNAKNGSIVWQTYLARENIASGLSYSYGRIYTVNENGVLYVLDALNGAKLSFYTFPAQMHSMPIPYNGKLYVATNDWGLYCFGDARIMAAASTSPSPSTTPTATPAASVEPTAIVAPTATTTPTNAPTATTAPTIAPIPTVAPTATAAPSASPETTTDNTNTYIIVAAVVVVIIVIAAAALLLGKRK